MSIYRQKDINEVLTALNSDEIVHYRMALKQIADSNQYIIHTLIVDILPNTWWDDTNFTNKYPLTEPFFREMNEYLFISDWATKITVRTWLTQKKDLTLKPNLLVLAQVTRVINASFPEMGDNLNSIQYFTNEGFPPLPWSNTTYQLAVRSSSGDNRDSEPIADTQGYFHNFYSAVRKLCYAQKSGQLDGQISEAVYVRVIQPFGYFNKITYFTKTQTMDVTIFGNKLQTTHLIVSGTDEIFNEVVNKPRTIHVILPALTSGDITLALVTGDTTLALANGNPILDRTIINPSFANPLPHVIINNVSTVSEGSSQLIPRLASYEEPAIRQILADLESLGTGAEFAKQYEIIVLQLMQFIFDRWLKDYIPGFPVDQRDGIIDIICHNVAEQGIFQRLKQDLNAGVIVVECKNISTDLRNTEFNQISDRLSPSTTRLGFLFCRKNRSRSAISKQVTDRWRKHEHCILVFEDKYIERLVELRLNNEFDAIESDIQSMITSVKFGNPGTL